MARENKTKYAVLGLLAVCPMSGYDIKKLIERSLGFFWSESYGQIYPILREITEEGLATRIVEEQEGKPDRHEYAITASGRDELHSWLLRPAEPQRERVETLLKLFFGAQISLETSIEHVERCRAENLALLEVYRYTEEYLKRNRVGDPEQPFWLLALNAGFWTSRAMVSWCDETLAELRRMAGQPQTDPRAELCELLSR